MSDTLLEQFQVTVESFDLFLQSLPDNAGAQELQRLAREFAQKLTPLVQIVNTADEYGLSWPEDLRPAWISRLEAAKWISETNLDGIKSKLNCFDKRVAVIPSFDFLSLLDAEVATLENAKVVSDTPKVKPVIAPRPTRKSTSKAKEVSEEVGGINRQDVGPSFDAGKHVMNVPKCSRCAAATRVERRCFSLIGGRGPCERCAHDNQSCSFSKGAPKGSKGGREIKVKKEPGMDDEIPNEPKVGAKRKLKAKVDDQGSKQKQKRSRASSFGSVISIDESREASRSVPSIPALSVVSAEDLDMDVSTPNSPVNVADSIEQMEVVLDAMFRHAEGIMKGADFVKETLGKLRAVDGGDSAKE